MPLTLIQIDEKDLTKYLYNDTETIITLQINNIDGEKDRLGELFVSLVHYEEPKS